jgi:hypothetical protein
MKQLSLFNDTNGGVIEAPPFGSYVSVRRLRRLGICLVYDDVFSGSIALNGFVSISHARQYAKAHCWVTNKKHLKKINIKEVKL